ncbi:MAG TPA: TetR/AcrR family transcriptional regulator [Herpetosiphonaceae bacterium]|nr:TetR/AcrR family transcriptional regulator [Herpetosiphonaceae bacterium]
MDEPAPLKPRKQPRQQRSAFMVEMILAAAARVLEQHGLDGFNTNHIAAVAGISIGSLYQYFPNKHAVMAALIDHAQSGLVQSIGVALAEARGLPLAAGLRRLIRAAIAYQFESPRLALVLDYEEQRLPVAATLATTARLVRGQVRGLLEAHRAGIAAADLDLAADDLLALVRALIDAAARRPAPDLDALEERLLKAALGYLA